MSEQFRVLYTSLADGVDKEQAAEALQKKLKLNQQQIDAFFNKNPLFSPSDKAKALKQSKAFAAMGIQTRLVSQAPQNTSQGDRDEQILTALDYITSSLIRLEEKLDDLESRINTDSPAELVEEIDDEWQEELAVDDELESPIKSRTRLPLIILGAGILLLLIVLAVALVYPELFTL